MRRNQGGVRDSSRRQSDDRGIPLLNRFRCGVVRFSPPGYCFRRLREMAGGPAPFSDIGKKTRDLLTKDYNFDDKFTLTVPSPTGMGLTATGLKKDQIFVGDISTVYKSDKTIVDVKVDTNSHVSTKVTFGPMPNLKTSVSFKVPDQKSGKFDVQYPHPSAAIDAGGSLNPTPLLDLSAAIGSKDVSLGGEIGFNTSSASLAKYNAGIGFNGPDFSAAVLLVDKGQTIKALYIHSVNPLTAVAAELTHRFSTNESSLALGSSHLVDPITVVKSWCSDNAKVAPLCQHQWRPNSLITFSAEYDSKTINASPKFGLALALKP